MDKEKLKLELIDFIGWTINQSPVTLQMRTDKLIDLYLESITKKTENSLSPNEKTNDC